MTELSDALHSGAAKSPGREWFAASCTATELQRAAVARLLGTANRYALAPFAAMRTGDGWQLGVALQPPPYLDVEAALQWQPDCDVVFINPATGTAKLAGDEGGWIVGDIPHSDTVALYSNGLTFARAWAAQRAAWLDLHKRANVPGLALSEPQNSALPGLLLAGSFKSVCDLRLLLSRARIAVDDPGLIRPLAAALLRAKRVPIVEAIAPQRREVAA